MTDFTPNNPQHAALAEKAYRVVIEAFHSERRRNAALTVEGFNPAGRVSKLLELAGLNNFQVTYDLDSGRLDVLARVVCEPTPDEPLRDLDGYEPPSRYTDVSRGQFPQCFCRNF